MADSRMEDAAIDQRPARVNRGRLTSAAADCQTARTTGSGHFPITRLIVHGMVVSY
jgi:hypothetical protein